MKVQILTYTQDAIYEPCVEEGIELTSERKGTPAKLVFKVLKDRNYPMYEGQAVTLKVDEKGVFYGYIFTKSRDKEQRITYTCYDQLRYFKNKDTYVYTGLTAGQFIQLLCEDFRLNAGDIADTGYVIQQRIEYNKTLFDMVQNALDTTMMNTNELYCLYDKYGAITLSSIADMKVPIVIDSETGQNFDYQSSIDGETYNKIKLIYDNKNTGKRDVYIAQDGNNMNQWGILQYFDTLQEGENGDEKVSKLLSYYNQKSRNLSIKDAWGDIRIRAGASPIISLKLGDITVNNFMLCEKVTHRFSNNMHTMDLTLIGGEFIA
ncbi:XkdQ/YqbQ family protein [Konateibacter massiliensis]|uniref:XkdQ/YqbQ family protein n=1 Tax=Konateibacter massiliensis TaxID=2002841 RepID=UPI000C154A8E|nr:hydrolase [Konateibacter massiliensis]